MSTPLRPELKGEGREKWRRFEGGAAILVGPAGVKAAACRKPRQVLEARGGGQGAVTAVVVKPIVINGRPSRGPEFVVHRNSLPL